MLGDDWRPLRQVLGVLGVLLVISLSLKAALFWMASPEVRAEMMRNHGRHDPRIGDLLATVSANDLLLYGSVALAVFSILTFVIVNIVFGSRRRRLEFEIEMASIGFGPSGIRR